MQFLPPGIDITFAENSDGAHALPHNCFFQRVAAAGIDFVVIVLPCWLLGFAVFFATALCIDPVEITLILLFTNLFMILAPAAIAALFESSKLQASPGKLLLRIKVIDTNGNRCSFARALARNLAFVLSDASFLVGYLLPLWTKRSQCLHDLFTNCLVIKRS